MIVLQNDKYRANAIKYALDYFVKDGEIESEYNYSLITHLIKEGVIDQYEVELKDSKLSDEDKKYVQNLIEEKKQDRYIISSDNDD